MVTAPGSGFARFVPSSLRSAHAPGTRVELEGNLLSIDVAGFTTLSERLQVHGSQGAEQMSELLGRFFDPAIDCVLAGGGDVIGFAGDSVLAVFPGLDPETEERVARAATAVLAAADAVSGVETLVGRVDLRARVGIGTGAVTLAVAGNEQERRVVAAGSGVDDAVDAQGHARVGEVEHRRASGGSGRAPAPTGGARAATDDDVLARFVPQALARRMRAGGSGLVDELRAVTSTFIGLAPGTGIDDLLDVVPSVLDAAEHFGGTLIDIDCTDKGAALFLAFGAPVANAEDPSRAVACMQELDRQHRGDLRMGIATGRCFSGIVGSPARATYTVCGDSVNLAARLMQVAARGEIVADAATRTGTGDTYSWAGARDLRVKGKETPVAVAKVSSSAPAAPVGQPVASRLVGRDSELAILRGALSSAGRGRGRTVVVTGPAGVGKSRLAFELVEQARADGVTVATDRFELTQSRSPYAGTRALWTRVLDLPDGAGVAELVTRLSGLDHDATGVVPALAAVLGLRGDPDVEAESDVVAESDVTGETVRAVFLELLTAATAAGPWLVVLDDVHWADAASRELIGYVVERIESTAVCVVLLGRPPNPYPHALTRGFDLVELGELDVAESELLARTLLGEAYDERDGDDSDRDDDAMAVARRAGGNPLFLVELARWISSGERGAPPTTLSALVLSAVDHLSPPEQTAIRSASVLGRSFRARDLVGSFGREQLPDVEDALDGLTRAGYLPHVASADGPAYVFRSDTLQESLYESLSHGSRRRLHEAAGSWFEREFADDLDPHLDVLAHHFGRSANAPKQRTYYALAGRRSARLFANDDAIDYFERLVEVLDDDVDAGTRRELGELYAHVGRPVDAEVELRRAVGISAPHADPFALAALGRLLAEHQARLDEARAFLTEAVERAETLGDDEAHLAVLSGLAIALGQAGDLRGAEAAGREHLTLAQRLGNRLAEAAARTDIAVNVEDQGRLDESYEELLTAWRIVEDRPGVHRWKIESYLFRVCERRAELLEAAGWLHRAAESARTIGHEPGLALNLGDEARLRLNLGDGDGARACCLHALRLAIRLRDGRVVRQQLLTLALLLPDGIDPDELHERAEAVARVGGTERDLAGVLLERVKAEVARGSLDAAAAATAEATAQAAGTTAEMRDQAALSDTLVAFEQERIDRGEAQRRLRSLAATAVTEHDRVDALHELAKITADDEVVRREAIDAIASLYDRAPYLYLSGYHWELSGDLLPVHQFLDPVPTDPHALPVAELLRRVDLFLTGEGDPSDESDPAGADPSVVS